MTVTITSSPITRGELAKRFGCHLETVRYYEKIGLLYPPARSKGGHRIYKSNDQRRLRCCQSNANRSPIVPKQGFFRPPGRATRPGRQSDSL
jgi:hypothetical protein